MIEKNFDKMYAMKGCREIPQSTFTRIANRLLKEYVEVNGNLLIPEEIQAIVDAIKRGKDTDEYDYDHTYEINCVERNDRTYDTCKTMYENHARAFWDTDEYGDPVYHATWYFFTSETYTKRVGNQTIRAGSYSEINRKVYAAKGKYRYYCTHRPPSPGLIPAGFISYETYLRGSEHIGEVTYNEKPDAAELTALGLVFDPNYAPRRKIYTEAKND